MDLLGDLEVSDKGVDEEINEEDYDPRTLEEMKERSEPQFYDAEDIPDLTVLEAKPCQASKASKMLQDAIVAELENEVTEVQEIDFMSPDKERDERAYGYGIVGQRMQRRMPLKQPYEQMLQAHMVKLRHRIEKKVRKYKRNGNEEKLRKYLREKWAIEGMQVKGFEFQTVLVVHDRFVRLDLVPTHYNYPDFYRF